MLRGHDRRVTRKQAQAVTPQVDVTMEAHVLLEDGEFASGTCVQGSGHLGAWNEARRRACHKAAVTGPLLLQ